MALQRTCVLAGVTLYPDEIETGPDKVGDELVSADGTRTYIHRGSKRQYVLRWRSAPESVRVAVRTLYATTGSMAFTDDDGASVTVYTPPGGYRCSLAYVLPTDPFGTMFQIELTLKEL